jgi:hypothetical protein
MMQVLLSGVIVVVMLAGPPAFVIGLALREQRPKSIQPN